MPAFANVLLKAMDEGGLSFGRLAQRLESQGVGISKSQIWQTISGHQPNPSAPLCYVLARILKMDPLRLIEILLWSRANPKAEQVPDELPVLGGPLLIDGLEEDFVQRFRNLGAKESRYILDQLAFVESRGGGKDGDGSRVKRGRFRETDAD